MTQSLGVIEYYTIQQPEEAAPSTSGQWSPMATILVHIDLYLAVLLSCLPFITMHLVAMSWKVRQHRHYMLHLNHHSHLTASVCMQAAQQG